MALHFVSTSVLSSNDGISFDSEIKTNNEGINKDVSNSVSRPLYEQLAEQNEKKQAEYDANTKLIFAPPKALDDEEIEFYNTLDDRSKKIKDLITATEQEELKNFRKAVSKAENIGNQTKVIIPKLEKNELLSTPQIVVKSKRKSSSLSNENKNVIGSNSKKTKNVSETSADDHHSSRSTSVATAISVETKPSVGLGALMIGYGSDSDGEVSGT